MTTQNQSDGNNSSPGDLAQISEILKKNQEGMAAVMQAMQQMATSFTESMTSIQESIQSLNEHVLSGGGSSRNRNPALDDDDGDPDDDDTDFEHLSRAEFAQRLRKSFLKDMKELLKPLQETLETTHMTSSRTAAAQEAERVAAKYPDFWYFKEEMVKIAKENPELSVERIYKLAKAEASPEKLREVEQKIKEKEGDTQNQPGPGRPGFGGMPPSGRVALEPPKPGEKIDKITAAERAWNAVVPKDSPLATLDQETISQA